jgi:multidrug efflux system outer membrane protein
MTLAHLPGRAGRVPALTALLLSLGLAGCVNLAPDYARPAPAVPHAGLASAATPGPAADGVAATSSAASASGTAGSATTTDLALPDWRAVFLDDRLRDTVALALRQNRDLRIAALQIEQARAAFRQTDAQRLPTLNASGGASRSGAAGVTTQQVSLQLALSSYELDFFSRVRNLSDSAAQALFSREESRRGTQISLVSETAAAWLTWAADLERQRLAQETLASRERSLALTRRRHELGAISGLVLSQAETALESARADAVVWPTTLEQDRHALELLLGAALPAALEPRAADAAGTLSQLVDLPAGVPSSVLQRRPDVLAAEHSLIATHADIGAARAARFPSISLTASAGTGSRALSGLFDAGSGNWSFGPSVSLPIFDGGSRAAALRQAEASRDIALATYDKTIQTAFREVADALSERATLAARLAAQRALLASSERQLRLAEAQYRVGSTTQLDLLDAQRSLLGAQQSLIALRLSEQLNRVTLYKVLGGGWQDVTPVAPNASPNASPNAVATPGSAAGAGAADSAVSRSTGAAGATN